ncbi:MAG: oligosaccharide flippase family protein [Kiritimatiellia bacterium]
MPKATENPPEQSLKKMALRKRIVLNIGSSWASSAVVGAVGVIIVPVMLNSVGKMAYGVWALVASTLSYVTILDAAFSLAVNRFVAYYRYDQARRNSFVSASFVLLSGMAVITALGGMILSFFVHRIFPSIPRELAWEARTTCALVGLTLACRMLESVFRGAVQGFELYTWSNTVTIVANVVRLFCTVTLLWFWKSIVAVQAAYLMTAMVSALLMFVHARLKVEGMAISLSLVGRDTMMEIFRYTGHSLARTGSRVVTYCTMTLLLGWFGTPSDIAVYSVASTIPGFIEGLLAGAQNVFLPSASRLFAEGHVEQLRNLVKKGTLLSAVLTCIPVILICAFSEQLLSLWLRSGVVPGMTIATRVQVLANVPNGFFGVWLPVLVGMGYLRGLTYRAVGTMVIAIVTELVLLQGLVAPYLAPGLALLIGMGIGSGVWLPLFGLKKLQIPVLDYCRESLYRPTVATALSLGFIWVLSLTVGRLGLPSMVCATGAAVFVSLIFSFLCLRNEVVEAMGALRRKLIEFREQRA